MKTKTILTQKPIPRRLQGTDGVRREIRLAKDSECRKQTPQQVFLEKGWITEEFMELYAYCFVKKLTKKKTKLSLLILKTAAAVLKKTIDIKPVTKKENPIFFVIL